MAKTLLSCPYCLISIPPDPPDTPVNAIGQAYRDHLRTAHPVQHHDLHTTRWHDGLFVRSQPPISTARILTERRGDPPPGHGLAQLVSIDSDDANQVVVFCACGWKEIVLHGAAEAQHVLRVHYQQIHRLVCPYCGWHWESEGRDDVEREMARHIGVSHPERFPWGYAGPSLPREI